LAFAGLASAAFFAAQPASASIIPFTVTYLNSPRNAYSFNSPVDLTRQVEITNDNTVPVTISTISAVVGEENVTGNPNDYVSNVSLAYDVPENGNDFCYDGRSLAVGASCYVDMVLTLVGVPNVLHPNYYGESEIVFTVDSSNHPNADVKNDSFDVDVYDPSATPEPGNLLLLGTGMLGLAGVVRRKLGRG
jgi:hypothetical protein